MPSYDDIPPPQGEIRVNKSVEDLIAKDKVVSLQVQLEMARELVTHVDRGVKNMKNLQSPLSMDD